MPGTGIVTVVARIYPKAGKDEEVAALLVQMAEAVRHHEPDCLVYRPHRLAGHGGAAPFFFYEQYRSMAAFDSHRAAPHLAAFRGRMKELLARPTEVEIYAPLTD